MKMKSLFLSVLLFVVCASNAAEVSHLIESQREVRTFQNPTLAGAQIEIADHAKATSAGNVCQLLGFERADNVKTKVVNGDVAIADLFLNRDTHPFSWYYGIYVNSRGANITVAESLTCSRK